MRLGWIILLVIVATSLAEEITMITKGFMAGFEIKEPFDDIIKCIDPNSKKKWEEAIERAKKIEGWNNTQRAEVVKILMEVYMTMFIEISMCSDKVFIDFVDKVIDWKEKIEGMKGRIEKTLKEMTFKYLELIYLWNNGMDFEVGEFSGKLLRHFMVDKGT